MIGRDVYFFLDDINKENARIFVNTLRETSATSKNKTCLLFLVTNGGDPDAAYIICKALHNYYEIVQIAIPANCKSAGTLIAIGAHTLYFHDLGELGPLDIQLSKDDELSGLTSSLVAKQGLTALISTATSTFEESMVSIFSRSRGRITTKTAAEIAVNLTGALFEPVMQQFDPMRVGEHDRSTSIALEYGSRLNKKFQNLKDDALKTLIYSYPSHSFVIDFTEAQELFHRVQKFDPALISLLDSAIQNIENKGNIFALPDIDEETANEERVTDISKARAGEDDSGIDESGARLREVH